MPNDYYDILGVSRTATADEIKRAFRKKAHQYHPDKQGGNEAKFKEVNEAYQVLSNKGKRQQYDQFGATYEDMRRNGGGFSGGQNPFGNGFGGRAGPGFDFSGFDDLGDVFSEFFGMRTRTHKRGPARGRDVALEIMVDFEQAVFGVAKEVAVNLHQTCSRCKGNGAEPGAAIETCATCRGAGQVQQVQNSFFGQVRTSAICPSCAGQGKRASQPCAVCKGEGVELQYQTLSVDIPAGIDDGQVLKLSGKGEAGRHGGPSGDLLITVRVRESKNFVRDGSNLHSTVEIGFAQAALGDEIPVKTIDGEGKLVIPKGIQSGTQLRIRAKGVPKLHGSSRGDHLVTVNVKTPTKLSSKQKKLLEELRGLENNKGVKGWF